MVLQLEIHRTNPSHLEIWSRHGPPTPPPFPLNLEEPSRREKYLSEISSKKGASGENRANIEPYEDSNDHIARL